MLIIGSEKFRDVSCDSRPVNVYFTARPYSTDLNQSRVFWILATSLCIMSRHTLEEPRRDSGGGGVRPGQAQKYSPGSCHWLSACLQVNQSRGLHFSAAPKDPLEYKNPLHPSSFHLIPLNLNIFPSSPDLKNPWIFSCTYRRAASPQ